MKNIVFVDVDNVLLRKQSQELFLFFLLKNRAIDFFLFVKVFIWFLVYKLGFEISSEDFRKRMYLKIFRGFDCLVFDDLTKRFFQECLVGQLNKEIENRILLHIKEGDCVVLLSATLESFLDYIASMYSISFYFGVKLERGESGILTGKIIGSVPYGEEKLVVAKSFLDQHQLSWEGTSFWADHHSDLRLLECVEKPVICNPSRKLRHIAEERGWEIHDF